MKQNTNLRILADRTALLNSRDAYEEAKITLSEREDLVDSIMAVGRQFIMLGRDNLKPYLGNEYSQKWDATGMVGSIAAPDKPELLHPLLDSYHSYYTAHPEREVVDLNLTAIRAGELSAQLLAAMGAATEQDKEVIRLKGIRDVNAENLLRRLRGLRNELGQILGPLDPLWKAFGFNLPGADQKPDEVEGITATLLDPATAALKWEASARAEYYRVWKRVQGIDEEYVAVGTPADLDFTIEGLPANSTIEIQISAVNNGGESARSTAITIVTH